MRKNRFFTRFVVAPVVVAVGAGGSMFLGGVANAAGSPGTLTFAPQTGADVKIFVAHTSAGCDPVSSAAFIDIRGPVNPGATPVFPATNPFNITTAQNNDFSTTGPFDVPAGVSVKDAATQRGKTITSGQYDLVLHCVDQDTLAEFNLFKGSLVFTDPTHYQTTDSNATPNPNATPTPTPTEKPSPTPTPPSATPIPSPTASTPPDSATATPAPNGGDIAGTSTPSDPGGGTQTVATTGALASTGAPIGLIFLVGLILLAAGLALVVWLRRPPRKTP